jgi:transcriptional regulator with XRE-family HTH domain
MRSTEEVLPDMSLSFYNPSELDVNPDIRLQAFMGKRGRAPRTPLEKRPEWARRLVQAREAAGMTQAELSEASKIPQQSIGGYEAGRTEPDIAKVKILADKLGVDPGWIAFGDPDKSDAPLGANIERYQKDEAFIPTFFRTAAMLRDEGFDDDLHFAVRLAVKFLEQAKRGSDVLSLRERIDAAVTAERLQLRDARAILKKDRI